MLHKLPKLIVPLVILTALIVGGWYIDRERTASRSTLSGFFENQPAEVASKVGGRVLHINVKEGDTVRAGQAVIELDSATASADLRAQNAAAMQAAAHLSLVNAGPRPEDIAHQKQVVAEARAAFSEALAGPRPQQIAQARAQLREAQANYDKAVAGPRSEDKLQAAAKAMAAKAKLDAAIRGLTPDQIAQFKDRLDAADSQERLASQDFERYKTLYAADAVTRQQFDTAKANLTDATAHEQEARDAYANAVAGTPMEELDQTRNEYQAARQAQELLNNGSRPEDIAAAKANRDAVRQALNLLLAGTRQEDIGAARARLGQAQSGLDALLAGSRPQEKAEAQEQLKQALATVRAARINLSEHIVFATKPGIVDRILVAVGDVVNQGSPVARIDDPTDIWIRVYIPESQLGKIKTGSAASLKVDGIDAPEAAYIESVASQGEFTPANLQTPDERGKQVFEVRLRLRNQDTRVKAGMYATVKSLGGASL